MTGAAVRRLREVGEHRWIARLVRRLGAARPGGPVLVGIGDDAAAIRPGRRPLLLTVDALVEGVHFRRGWLSSAALGRRAFAINASDVAAMGGVPLVALLALEAPSDTSVADLDAVAAGCAAAARRAGAYLLGGNLARGPHLAVTVALVGEAPGRVVTRAGARPGDLLFVTGALGAAGLAVRELAARRRGRLPHPPSRAPVGVRLARVAHAMIDVSDGLLQDLGHLCRASGVGAELELGRLPVARACRAALGNGAAEFAATAGEDYELLVAVPARRVRALARLARGCPITCVGRIVDGRPVVRVRSVGGAIVRLRRKGFDHFRGAPGA
jgi:thiamine-monophosphate kinase